MSPIEREMLDSLVSTYPEEVLRAILPHLLTVVDTSNGAHQIGDRPGRRVGRPNVLTEPVKAKIRRRREKENLSAEKIAGRLRLARSTVANCIAAERKAASS